MKREALLDIGFPSGGPREDEIARLHLTDAKSGVSFLEIDINITEFARGVFRSLYHRPCLYELRALQNIGKTLEIKDEVVPEIKGNYTWDRRAEKERAAVAPFEVDGWMARSGDYDNGHRMVRAKGSNETAYKVQFYRFVGECAIDDIRARDEEIAKLKDAIEEQRRTIVCLMEGCEEGTTPVIRRLAHRDELIAKARALLERWDSPLWKDLPATATYIEALRKAVEAG